MLDLSGGGERLLEGKAERVFRSTPWNDATRTDRGIVLFGTGYDPLAPSVAAILGLRTLGTVVEVYRLP